MKRRKFILSLVGTAAAGISGWTLHTRYGQAGSVARRTPGAMTKVTRGSWALGTTVTLTAFHQDPEVAEAAILRAFEALGRVESVMSLYRPDSQLCELNRTGRLERPDPSLVQVLKQAQALSAQTDGVFDVTVQPLWDLYYGASQNETLPGAAAIAAARAKVDWRNLEISADGLRLRGDGTAVTLNGIAQGFAADVVKQVLVEGGIEHALIDTGEIDSLGSHAQKDQWSVAIKHPRDPGASLGIAGLKGRSLATSGDYETTFDAGFRHHHLLDPRTGDSPVELSSVSVAAPTGLQADALSTAVFLLGLREGRQLIESTPGADALFVTKDGKIEQTAGFPLLG